MLERHQHISEEKISIVNNKYDHIKALNLAMQVRCLRFFFLRRNTRYTEYGGGLLMTNRNDC